MRLKATIAALVLAAAPVLVPATGFAACNWGMEPKSTTASTCAEGQVYDPTSGTCVSQATS